MKTFLNKPVFIGCASLLAYSVSAIALQSQQTTMAPSLGMFGTTGLIDMPSAESQPDAELTTNLATFSDFTRGTFTFQLTPRLSGSFRYSQLKNWALGGPITKPDYFDRSFDFQYRLLDERKYTPAVAVGLRDFMGTGVYSSQYLVATKNLGPKLKVTGGLGWGRLSDTTDVTSIDTTLGGKPNFDSWFRGAVGGFGGIEWQTPVDGLRVKAEYSSDHYVLENELLTRDGQNRVRTAASFERKSPVNFGLEYRTKRGMQIGAYYMYGSEVGLSFSTALNPKRNNGFVDRAPIPIHDRGANYSRSTDWTQIAGIKDKAREHLDKELNKDKIRIEALNFNGVHAEARIENKKYGAVAQAVGRTARAMAKVFPDSIESFTIVPVNNGLASSAITINRRDLETLENHVNGAELLAGRVDITDAKALSESALRSTDLYPKLTWGISPFVTLKVFDSDNPFAISGGIRAEAKYQVSPGFSISASASKRLVSGDNAPSPSYSGLQHVRTDIGQYNLQANPGIDQLSVDYVFKLAPAVYGRISAGYLERMFGGVSAEVLWKRADLNWGIGAELNYVKQREFKQLFGFQDYAVATGHISAYYETKNGFEFQVDVGRYLAGDVGATVSVDRSFDNGWRVGAYASITDADATLFGEGRFDKGVRLEIPIGWALGTASQSSMKTTLTSLTRDGGQRLNVNNRLYETVRDSHTRKISGAWGRIWQ
jgi:hypothetical protein